MIHHRLTPIVFLINNSGYNIERNLHGPNRLVTFFFIQHSILTRAQEV